MAGKSFPCKTLKCLKCHVNTYAAGQCSRRYGPKINPSKFDLEDTPIIDELYDYEYAAEPIPDSFAPEEEDWALINGEDLSDGDTSSHHDSDNMINDHLPDSSEVNDVI